MIRFFGLILAPVLMASSTSALADPSPPQRSNDPASLRAEAFEAAQLASTSVAAAALTKVAAAFAQGNGNIASLERKRDDLGRQLKAAETLYADLLGSDDSQRVQARKEAWDNAIRSRKEIAAVEAQITREDPGYFELTRPRALTVAETQALLNPDEAVLLMMVGEDATYSFAVSHDAIEWSRAPDLGDVAIDGKISQLRGQLSSGSRYDTASAAALYHALVQPLDKVLAGKRLVMTVANGPLAAFPLQLLVTEATGSSPRYLIDRYAMTTLPAVSSLNALRCLLVDPARRHPGCGAERGSGRQPPGQAIELVGFGAPVLDGAPGDQRGIASFDGAFKGPLADTNHLRQLAPLPGSKRELDTLSSLFGTRARIRTGTAATESAVKDSAELQGARYVIFSTHGLLAGEGGIQGEPGLVLTPPPEAAKSKRDDGLLTASEAAQLSLSADFVILSACNTAAADGTSGGEGLSGMARSFFYAGARAVLVSHWRVSDQATASLITHTLASGGASDRAEALRQAIFAVRADPRWASPSFWGVFTLVGVPE